VVKEHCQDLREKIDEYKKKWVDVAKPFLATLVPANIPATVVYPFGGGDLLTALSTYPNATELTAISLEKSGDARLIDSIAKTKLRSELETNRKDIERLFKVAHSKTTNLEIVSSGSLPGELVFDLTALAVHDMEPVSLKYFTFAPDGTLVYLSEDDLKDKKKSGKEAFSNMEIVFKPVGQPGPLRTFRHVSMNLDDKHLKADPSLMKHLEAKGKVAAMTKAASYLLWNKDFSTIRQYLLDHMEWMISDSTGILPAVASKAGFEQLTYGTYEGPFLGDYKNDDADLKKLWKTNPHQDLAFRYGYPDSNHHSHMMVTRRVHN
jgi:hypothetical protein